VDWLRRLFGAVSEEEMKGLRLTGPSWELSRDLTDPSAFFRALSKLVPDDSILFSHQAAPSGLFRFDPLTHRVEPVPGAARLLYPKCSLQGDVLATSNDEQGARWKLRRSGTAEWRDVGPSQGAYPSWTRDGRSVCSLSVSSHRIDCLRLDTGRVDPITDTSAFQLAVWVVVPWMGLDAQDRPLVTATTTRSTNLYALDWEP
jgi:hypothetical protein